MTPPKPRYGTSIVKRHTHCPFCGAPLAPLLPEGIMMKRITARSSQYVPGARYTVTANGCEGSVPGEYEVIAIYPWNGKGDRDDVDARCALILGGLGREKAEALVTILNAPAPGPQYPAPPEVTRLADSAGDMSAGAAREAVLRAYRIGTGEES